MTASQKQGLLVILSASEVSTCKVRADKQQTRFIALACKDNLIKIYACKVVLLRQKREI